MRRGRNKSNKRQPPLVVDDTRTSTSPIVVVCHSNACNTATASETTTSILPLLCSHKNAWSVWIYNPDIHKWWDQTSSKKISLRASHPPAEGTLCHLVLMFDGSYQNDHMIHNVALLLGERLEFATVAVLQGTSPLADDYKLALQDARKCEADFGNKEQGSLQQDLWSLQDAFDTPKPELLWDGEGSELIKEICSSAWPLIVCRWNIPRLRNLYQQLQVLRRAHTVHDDNSSTDKTFTLEKLLQVHSPRQEFERKMEALFLQEDDSIDASKRVADQVLRVNGSTCTASDQEDNAKYEFGRKLALSAAYTPAPPECRYLVAKRATTLTPLAYATGNQCSSALDQLQIVQDNEKQSHEGLAIPIGNPMITMRLIPALLRTGAENNKSAQQLDRVLGSRRIWEEHLALKVSILYLFEGQSSALWELAMTLVKAALPKTWEMLFASELPDEAFLRALLHPDVIDGGRLWRQEKDDSQEGQNRHGLPRLFESMARIYSIARFFKTLPRPVLKKTANDNSIQRSLALTMKISFEQVKAIAGKCLSEERPIGTEDCITILQMQGSSKDNMKDSKRPASNETLGMLALFLHRDRQSYHDTSSGKVPDLPPIANCTSQVLADCAMFCGAIRWLSEEDQYEEGLWTCLQCLHRWQMRGQREAFQTRKLMHPMKMTPFFREEYYDPDEWKAIMKATGGEISKLGRDYYWGNCSVEGCRRITPAVARAGACAETDGVLLEDFPETIVRPDGTLLNLRAALGNAGALGPNVTVTSETLEKYFDSEEKLAMVPGGLRRRVRNCMDKSRYILPAGVMCDTCSSPTEAIDDYCPYCGLGFEPVFACVHYSCPRCHKHFCKACLGIDGIHFNGVYNKANHVCWRILRNRYAYQNKGFCAKCGKERNWPESHRLESAGPYITSKAISQGGMDVKEAVALQANNLAAFTKQYKEGAAIFEAGTHTAGLGVGYCHCGSAVDADEYGDD